MKNIFYLILFIATLYATFAHAQTKIAEIDIMTDEKGNQLFQSMKVWKNTKHVVIKDGLIYKWNPSPSYDTAHLFEPGTEEWEAVITFRKKGTVPPPVVIEEKIIDVGATTGTFASWTYVGPVNPTTTPGWYNNTIAFSNQVNGSWTYTFKGTGIEVYAERIATHGTGKVSIDGGPEFDVKFNVEPYGKQVLVYSNTSLANGSHTLKLRVVSGYNLLDYVKVFAPKQ